MFYGAAEFSRDVDLLVLIEAANLERLRKALEELQAEVIAVPPFRSEFLEKGHEVHFRCRREDVSGLRIDVMTKLRESADFEQLWARRTTIEAEGDTIDMLSLADLVRAKKTQRDKDWPMIRRLIEQDYFLGRGHATAEHVRFWMLELRTPELLSAVCQQWPKQAEDVARERPAVAAVLLGDLTGAERSMALEIEEERKRDRAYWAPLRAELEELRRNQRGT